ncbi:MAG: hypothetical protein ACFFAY_13225 [Promethearchaeota archaeon]
MRKVTIFLIASLFIVSSFSIETDATDDRIWSNDVAFGNPFLASSDLILDGLTWIAYDVDCREGDTLSGSFEVTCDGSLYYGDARKYDDWSLEGIEVYILDSGNFSLFTQKDPFTAVFERNNVQSLSWTFEAPSSGTWYIVYENKTVYLMTVEGSINLPAISPTTLAIALIILGAFGSLGLLFFKKRR